MIFEKSKIGTAKSARLCADTGNIEDFCAAHILTPIALCVFKV